MDVIKKLSSVQEISKTLLSKIFSVNSSKKFLIIEPNIIKALERVCGVKWLRASGIEKIFKLEHIAPSFDDNIIFYIISSEFKIFMEVVDHIRAQVDIENPPTNKFHIIVCPQYTYLFEEELEQLGMLETVVKLHSFQWMPIHLDVGILSLEIASLYNSLFVYENFTMLTVLARTLWQLSFVTGKPKFILSLGQHSNSVLNCYDNMCEEKGDTDKDDSDFGALILMDRNIDYISALLTPGTYSGLLSEVYPVKSGICDGSKYQNMIKKNSSNVDEKYNCTRVKHAVSTVLSSQQDDVYADIKNRYFTEVTSELSNLTKQLQSEKDNSKEMALDEIKVYVQTQLQATRIRKKCISNHLLIAESIINTIGHRYEQQKEVEIDIMKNANKSANINYLEQSLAIENDPCLSLRLFCLLLITQRLSENEVQTFWRKFLHQFGYNYGYAYYNLVNMGFIEDFLQNTTTINIPGKINLKIPKFMSKNFYTNAENLQQIPSDPSKINLKHPTCPSYAYGGAYIPLIVKIANMLLNSASLDDIKSKLESFGPLKIRDDKAYPLHCRTILVYIIGGVTYAEIAACNLLEILTSSRICILSDRIINGNELMSEVLNLPK